MAFLSTTPYPPLTKRAISPHTGYTIILPVILGVVFIALCIYLFWSFRQRKAQQAVQRRREREQSMKTWGKDMGPVKGKDSGGDGVLLAAQGLGRGLMAAGRG
ncbi:hypothetical protein GLAREA_06660 [Glarea lozoyensis ATCC 20868]|uniref:Uncharacterized protein n=1 Tax=Glarea lozoyensis (strain ATCC 20868 / MF5171) TaxID=1116229 RepID=S3D5A3_GLAL2|nr:uncharacterized protein GLAREA_06660 [Glarea lozoyensis ATCC 20868]EPE33647.1 hypothetical protein GLAREA_06660 [Glarea lozoyensis ATCC 20868]